MTNQQAFLAQLDETKAKAKKSGKLTRLSPGQYFLYAGSDFYYVATYGEGKDRYWGWCKDGQHPDDAYSSFADTKAALLAYLTERGILHSLNHLTTFNTNQHVHCPNYHHRRPLATACKPD